MVMSRLSVILIFVAWVHVISAQQWHIDSIGDGYEMRYVDMGKDYSGDVRCTIIRRALPGDLPSDRGVLYIHGYNDYFFQREMGEEFNEHGYEFYALDLRKYGRSILPNQKPFVVRNFKDYFADVDSALHTMLNDGVREIVMMGHSTGGLLAAYYVAMHPDAPVSELILNSPFLDWNLGRLECFINVVSAMGSVFPNIHISTGGADVYGESLEKGKHGEWEYDTTKKSTDYGVNLGWVRAINKAQHDLRNHKGDIKIPVLLMYSAKSSNPKQWNEEASRTDVVLDVADIRRYGKDLGDDVTMAKVNGGIHDLLLSSPEVRAGVYAYIFEWLARKSALNKKMSREDEQTESKGCLSDVYIINKNIKDSMKATVYSQPQLPYALDELAPAISRETVEFHYGKHEKTYIDNLNKLIQDTEYENMALEDIIRNSEGALFNNASQAWNHIFYFFSFSPDGGGEPEGELRAAIDRCFGSFDNFKKKFVDAGTKIFGSGWVWLSKDEEGKLFITQHTNAGNPMTDGLTPLLTFDVWEHAYYLDFQNRRADALNALWKIVDWDVVSSRY